jgi:broad specificity phosphatase PhoE
VRSLTLVRHSLPEVRREIPPAEWHLSLEGAARARTFAERLLPTNAACVFTSCEPKAVETAQAIAGQLDLAVECVPGLHEHERPHAQMLTREAFEERIRDLFARPREIVFGAETADQARKRFTIAVLRLLARTAGDVLLVTHGTVMTLFVAEATGVDPFMFWKRQEMPFAVRLTLPELRLERTIALRTDQKHTS